MPQLWNIARRAKIDTTLAEASSPLTPLGRACTAATEALTSIDAFSAAERIPEFFAAIGPDGPVGYATNVSIEETNDPATGHPRSITVTGRSSSLDVTMELTIDDANVTKRGGGLFGGELDFLQLRARYRVRGRAGDRSIDFTASGVAETFRGLGAPLRK